MTLDGQAAKAYYPDVCGWSYDEMPMEDAASPYYVAMREGQPVAGIMDMTGAEGREDQKPEWCTYLAVDDVDAAIARTQAGC